MRILFVHQNFPGQFLYLAPHLARRGHEIMALSNRDKEVEVPGVVTHRYEFDEHAANGTHPMLGRFERSRRYGEAVADAALMLKRKGFSPDLIVAHPGWGETLFLGDVWPDARQLHYCEFHLNPYGPNQVFDAKAPLQLRDVFEARLNCGLNLFALADMDQGYAPTVWQQRQFPEDARGRISVVHDGINAALCRPNPDAVFRLPSGRDFRFGDRLVTYVARNLEPIRGFPEFMRAMQRLLAKDPLVEVAVVGGDELSYGRPHESGRPWREVILEEVDVDRSRIHFLGKLPYDDYIRLLQVSAAHVYLTTPFILSWSTLEAMAAGCLLIASDTEPVREVVEDGVNGLLIDFFDSDGLAERILACLSDPGAIRAAARPAPARPSSPNTRWRVACRSRSGWWKGLRPPERQRGAGSSARPSADDDRIREETLAGDQAKAPVAVDRPAEPFELRAAGMAVENLHLAADRHGVREPAIIFRRQGGDTHAALKHGSAKARLVLRPRRRHRKPMPTIEGEPGGKGFGYRRAPLQRDHAGVELGEAGRRVLEKMRGFRPEVGLEPDRRLRGRDVEAVEKRVDVADIAENIGVGVEEHIAVRRDGGDAGDLQFERIGYLRAEADDLVESFGRRRIGGEEDQPAAGNVPAAGRCRQRRLAKIFLAGR